MWFVACKLCSVYLTSLDLDLDLGLDLRGVCVQGTDHEHKEKRRERKRGRGRGETGSLASLWAISRSVCPPSSVCLVCAKTRACGGNTHDDTHTRNTAHVTKGIGENGGTV
jgi:hypothetical protein